MTGDVTELTAKLSIIMARRNPVIFDNRDRFIFFPNHKVCQRSITRAALADRAIVHKGNDATWQEKSVDVDVDYLSRMVTFTAVRNPYDRVVSAFFFLQGVDKIDKEYDFIPFCAEVLAKQGIFNYDRHFDCQSEGMFYEGKLIPEYLARFETLQDDWGGIASAIDGPPSLPHINMSKRKKTYVDYYDQKTFDLITELYADDLTNFGYEFEHSQKKRFFISDWFDNSVRSSRVWWMLRKAKSKLAVSTSTYSKRPKAS